MVARTGMGTAINRLRRMTESGTADYSVAGLTFWGDDDLEAALDRHLHRANHEALRAEPEWESGSMVYRNYWLPDYEFERNTGGDSVFRITDSNGSAIGTANYSVNYEQRRVAFVADQGAEIRYLSANGYDMHAAAAEVWDDKASHYQASFDFATDNHEMKRSQLIQQAQAMATLHRRKRKARTISMKRLDMR